MLNCNREAADKAEVFSSVKEKKMKFKFKVATKNNPSTFWWETYTENISDPYKFAKETIKNFNDTCQPGEKKRVFLKEVVVLSEVTSAHKWEKSNLVTIVEKSGYSHDTFKCAGCGITGNRLGLTGLIRRDKKYKASVYEYCDKATAQLEKLRERKQHKEDMAAMRRKWAKG